MGLKAGGAMATVWWRDLLNAWLWLARNFNWAHRPAKVNAWTGTEAGSKARVKGIESSVGTKIMGETHSRGLRVGSRPAMAGSPGSTDNHVEQTPERGRELRPEATWMEQDAAMGVGRGS